MQIEKTRSTSQEVGLMHKRALHSLCKLFVRLPEVLLNSLAGRFSFFACR